MDTFYGDKNAWKREKKALAQIRHDNLPAMDEDLDAAYRQAVPKPPRKPMIWQVRAQRLTGKLEMR